MNFWSERGFSTMKRDMTKTVSDNVKFTTAPTANRNRENKNVFCRCRSVNRRVTVSLQAYYEVWV